MTGYTVSVQPGPTQQITNAPIKSGSSLFNPDSTNGIWVGSNSSVKPNLGQFIGPQGSAEWTNDQSLLWACVDTGVLNSVPLTISDDLGQVNNPVAVATAIVASGLAAQIAQALLVTGVPNVLVESPVITIPAAGQPGFGMVVGTPVIISNLNNFATLLVSIYRNGLNPSNNGGTLQITFRDVSNNVIFTEYLSVPNLPLTTSQNTWQIPVSAVSAILINNGPGVLAVNIVGTNRASDKLRLLGQSTLPRRLQFTGTVVTNTAVDIGANDSGPSQTTICGEAYVRVTTSVIAGYVGYRYYDQNGVSQFVALQVFAASVNSWLPLVVLPNVPIQWVFLPTNSATGFVAVEVTSAGVN